MKDKKQSNVILIAILGGILVATVLVIGTIAIGHRATTDTQTAVHNVSLLYLDELARRRQQVVSTTINGYISDIGIALGLMEPEDLSSIEKLHAYQSRMKQLYRLERFAFVDENGLIHTSTGTRTDIDSYAFDYQNLSGSEVFVKTDASGEKQVAMQEELLEQEKKRVEQDSMITALSSDYRSVYYVDLEEDTAICYRRDRNLHSPYAEREQFSFTEAFTYYANHYVTEAYREEFLNFIDREHIQDALQKDIIISCRYLVKRGSEEKYESLRMAGVRHPEDRAGHIIHAVGVAFADIDSEMRESMAKSEMLSEALKTAEDANRAKSRFVSDMSHEIRTPITAILGMNEMINRECEDETILGYSDAIEKAGTSLLGIISDILDFSKIESGKIELVEVCYSLSAMI
ncbi:MAG: hypothetical protein K6G83_07460, partial [Lachnospiraceae bacterium]|nr:hypothetical protein [Lachnospiraceae bacterium]